MLLEQKYIYCYVCKLKYKTKHSTQSKQFHNPIKYVETEAHSSIHLPQMYMTAHSPCGGPGGSMS